MKSGHEEINKVLQNELSNRLINAGIEVQEARITELSYASEIANAMLKKQAALATVSARDTIVQGAVGIVGHAIKSLNEKNICELCRIQSSIYIFGDLSKIAIATGFVIVGYLTFLYPTEMSQYIKLSFTFIVTICQLLPVLYWVLQLKE